MRDIGHLSLTLKRSLFTYVLTISTDPYKYPDGFRITTPERRLSSSRDFCVCWDVDLHLILFSPQTYLSPPRYIFTYIIYTQETD